MKPRCTWIRTIFFASKNQFHPLWEHCQLCWEWVSYKNLGSHSASSSFSLSKSHLPVPHQQMEVNVSIPGGFWHIISNQEMLAILTVITTYIPICFHMWYLHLSIYVTITNMQTSLSSFDWQYCRWSQWLGALLEVMQKVTLVGPEAWTQVPWFSTLRCTLLPVVVSGSVVLKDPSRSLGNWRNRLPEWDVSVNYTFSVPDT